MMLIAYAVAVLLAADVPAEPIRPPIAPAAAAESLNSTDDLKGAEIVPDEELARHRGGFTWSGVQISLGAEIRTFLNGELALQTNISWTPAGAQTSQIVSGALTAADSAHLQAGVLTSAGITMHVGDQSVFLANQGQTVLLQRADNSLQNIIVNRASNVQISQHLDAVLNLQNFGQFQSSILRSRMGSAFGDMINQAVVARPGL